MTPRTFRRARVAGAVLVGGLAAGVGLRQLAHARTVQLVGRVVAHVDTPDSVVALTFDDGPVAGVADTLLTVLGARGGAGHLLRHRRAARARAGGRTGARGRGA
jgi:hypothetical protein